MSPNLPPEGPRWEIPDWNPDPAPDFNNATPYPEQQKEIVPVDDILTRERAEIQTLIIKLDSAGRRKPASRLGNEDINAKFDALEAFLKKTNRLNLEFTRFYDPVYITLQKAALKRSIVNMGDLEAARTHFLKWHGTSAEPLSIKPEENPSGLLAKGARLISLAFAHDRARRQDQEVAHIRAYLGMEDFHFNSHGLASGMDEKKVVSEEDKLPAHLKGQKWERFNPSALELWDRGKLTWLRDADAKKAVELFHQAEQQWGPEVNLPAISLGQMYFNGWGVEQSLEKAFTYYNKAIHHPDLSEYFDLASFQSTMGLLYRNGFGNKEDHQRAIAWYQKGVDQNHPQAQIALGEMYQSGTGVPEDREKAIQLFEAALGNPRSTEDDRASAKCSIINSEFNQGDDFYFGEDVRGNTLPQDFEQAETCYRNGLRLVDELPQSFRNIYADIAKSVTARLGNIRH